MRRTKLRGWRLLAIGGLLLLVASCDAGLFVGPAGERANEAATLELGEHLSVLTELDTMSLSVIVRDQDVTCWTRARWIGRVRTPGS